MASFLDSILGASAVPSSPTSQLISTSSISPWAQPYVSSYLQRAQELSTQGPTAAQQQVYNAAQNMGTPSQFGQGSNLLSQAGQGQLGTTGTALGYGALGAGYGGMAAGAGQNYANMATNPAAVGAYMNPYIEQALAPQLKLLNQQQALGAQNIAAKAVGQGAFGGNRATLAQGLNAQNYDLARQAAIGQGYDTAFKQAQQAQQYGAGLGLQGLQAAMQGAGIGLQGVNAAQQGYSGATQAGVGLGNLGAQQGQYGLAQLALQNQIANQQQQLPWQQLQNMQSMMGGLPVSMSTQQGYQAPPNYASQLAGYGLTGLGIYGMGKDLGWWGKGGGGSGGAGLGEVWGSPGVADTTYGNLGASSVMNSPWDPSTLAKGGKVKGYATGGDIKLKKNDQLQALLSNPNVTPMEKDAILGQLMLNDRVENNPASPQIMGGGIDTIPSGAMFSAAGGGIVAFAGDTDGSLVEGKKVPKNIANYESWLENTIRKKMEALDTGNPFQKSQELEAQYAQDIKDRQAKRPSEALIGLGTNILAGESPYAGVNIGRGGIGALQQMQKYAAEDAADRKLMLQQAVEQEKAKYGRDVQNLGALQTSLGQMYSKQIGLKNAAAAGSSANFWRAQNAYNAAVKDARDTLIDQAKKPGSEAYKKYRNDSAALERDAIANARREVGTPVLETLGLSNSKGTYNPSSGGGAAVPTLPPGFQLNQ